MAAVLGDFLSSATGHLDAALAARDLPQPAATSAVAATYRLTEIIARYSRGPLTAFAPIVPGSRYESGNGGRHELADANRWLQHATVTLSRDPRDDGHPVPGHICAAALALGTGHDLIATHHGAGSTLAWTQALGDADIRNAITGQISGAAHRAAELLDRAATMLPAEQREPVHRAASLLAELPTPPVPDRAAGELAAAIPLAGQVTLPPPMTGTRPLCEGIAAEAEAVRQSASGHDGTLWPLQRNGLALTVAAHCILHTVRIIGGHDGGHDFTLAGNDLDRIYHGGLDTQTLLQRLSLSPLAGKPPAATHTHLDNLVVRLGRLLYDNPSWTPARGDHAPQRSPEQLLADPDDITPITVAMVRATHAIAAVTAADQSAARRMRSAVTDAPETAAVLDSVHQEYGYLQRRCGAAVKSLRAAALAAAPDSQRDALRAALATPAPSRYGTPPGAGAGWQSRPGAADVGAASLASAARETRLDLVEALAQLKTAPTSSPPSPASPGRASSPAR